MSSPKPGVAAPPTPAPPRPRGSGGFRTILDASHDGIIIHDLATGAVVDANRRVCELHGVTLDELRAGGLGAIGGVVPPFLPDVAAAHIARAVAGETVRFEWCTQHRATGEAMWVEVGLQRATVGGAERLLAHVRDIRDRKRAEAERQASEDSYRAIFEASHDAILLHDAETGVIVDANRRACELHGRSRDELVGLPPSLVGTIPPFTPELALERMRRAAAGETLRFEWCALADGVPTWTEVSLQPVTIGGRRCVLALVHDISERKEAEARLREANEALESRVAARTAELAVANRALAESADRFRRLIENGNDLLMISSVDNRLTYVSPSAERLLGYTPEEMLEKEPGDMLHPDDVAPVLEGMRQIVESPGTVRRFAWRIRHKDGGWRLIDAIGRTLDPRSAADGVVCNGRDITEQREAERALQRSEEHFRALIEHSYDLVQVLDVDGRVVYTGPSVQRLLGYTPAEIAGGAIADFMHPDDLPAASALVGRVLASPGTAESIQYRVRHKDGSWRWLEAWARTLSPTTAAEGIVANARDMTERVRGEEALRRATAEALAARQEAERANVAKSEFLSRMSHELRTPMNSILGFAQILSESDLGAGDRNAVRHILTAGEHLLALINEVLDIARIEAGRHELSLEPVRLSTVLQEAIALVRPIAAARGVWVAESVDDAAERHVRADRQRLAQVLLNVLSNAVKYNRSGGSVRLACEVAGPPGGEVVRVRVEDTGHGIAAERRDQLFVPFARLGAERSGVEGTGLGLALSRRLMEAMGGTLELESTSPQGSVFRLDLALARAPAISTALPIFSRTPSLHARPEVKLVYVEDNLANLSLVEAVLAPYPGWSLVPALQGGLGVELALEHLPDLVLLDLHLPDMPGEEVLRRLRADARTAAVPVVVISADATPRSVERLMAAGADAYLTKPLNVKQFVATLERLLARGTPA